MPQLCLGVSVIVISSSCGVMPMACSRSNSSHIRCFFCLHRPTFETSDLDDDVALRPVCRVEKFAGFEIEKALEPLVDEAKNRLPELVREVEQSGPIQLTRRGKLVAVLLSTNEYERLQRGKIDFWEALLAFRKEHRLDKIDLDPDTIFADVRERSPGRDASWE